MYKNHLNSVFHTLTPSKEQKNNMLNKILQKGNINNTRRNPAILAAVFASLIFFGTIFTIPIIRQDLNSIRFNGYTEPDDIPNLYVRNMASFNKDIVIVNEPYARAQEGYYEYTPLSVIPSDTLKPVAPVHINTTVLYRNTYTEGGFAEEQGEITLPLDFVYAMRNGKIDILEDNSPTGDISVRVDYTAPHGSDYVWLILSYRQSHSIYLQYNVISGNVRDILFEAGLSAVRNSQMLVSADGDTALLRNPAQCYLVDVGNADYEEIKLGNAYVSYLNNTTLSFWTDSDSEAKNLYTYDIQAKKLTPVLTDVPLHSLAKWGCGVPVLREENSLSVIDPYTGEHYPIEGLNPELEYEFFPNPNGKRVGVLRYSETEKTTYVGFIDMEKHALTMSEIAAAYTGYWSWHIKTDRLDIELENDAGRFHFSYDFK